MALTWEPDELGYSHLLYESREHLLNLLHGATVVTLAVNEHVGVLHVIDVLQRASVPQVIKVFPHRFTPR
jgi:hypothetical protein